jgi:hypothetical protein
MATMGLTGSMAACSSAPARGMAGAVRGAGAAGAGAEVGATVGAMATAAAIMARVASPADAVTTADADLLVAAMGPDVVTPVADFTAEVVDSMAEVVASAEVDMGAAVDTGN